MSLRGSTHPGARAGPLPVRRRLPAKGRGDQAAIGPRRSRGRAGVWIVGVVAVVGLVALYIWLATSWSYSTGERAGWVQKFSRKGWLCKTWEGEMAMISMPGAATEKFYFTVWSDAVAVEVNKAMGKRVSLHYEEKVGLPTSCFGDTRHYVTRVAIVPEIPLSPGVIVPTPAAPVAPPAGAAAPSQ